MHSNPRQYRHVRMLWIHQSVRCQFRTRGKFNKVDIIAHKVVHLIDKVNELEVPDGCKVRRISFGHCGLVAAVSGSFCDDIGCRLSIWRMNSPVDIVHLEILKLPLLDNTGYLTNMGMNEKYIAVFIHYNIPNGRQNSECYFFSTQTFNLERSVSVMDSRVRYKQGCLLVNNYVRHNIR
jgi:hypothetical protein